MEKGFIFQTEIAIEIEAENIETAKIVFENLLNHRNIMDYDNPTIYDTITGKVLEYPKD